MAARENQGYLIAVIILVLLVLVLGLLAFLGISKANEYAEGIAQAKADLAIESTVGKAHQIEAEILRGTVGNLDVSRAEIDTLVESVKRLPNNSELNEADKTAIQNVIIRVEDAIKAYDEGMRQFVARTEDDQTEDLTWSGVVQHLVSVISQKHSALEVERQNNKADREKFESDRKELEERMAANDQDLAKITEDFENEKKRLLENEKMLLAKFEAAQQSTRENANGYEDKLKMSRMKQAALKAENNELNESNSGLKMKISDLTRENFDLHDGEIVNVARTKIGSDLVHLTIGRHDGLRTNQTFAVYDKEINNFEVGEQKAKIEVIRITGPHSSEARITEESPTNPITKYDLVVTPTWDPGYSVPIALSGIFDLDKDGNSDRLQFIRMIENNGGTIVAQHDEAGKVDGKIDSSTRYLVTGASPEPGSVGEDSGNIYNAMRELENAATKHSVQVIDMRTMLKRMGRHLVQVDHFDPKVESFTDRQRRKDSGSNSDEGSSTR